MTVTPLQSTPTLPASVVTGLPAHVLSKQVAAAILAGFNKHYCLFRAISSKAKALFEAQDWHGIQQLVADRIRMYDDRVAETVRILRDDATHLLNDEVWAAAKKDYIALLVNHKQPELAETFFNSVSTKLLDKSYYNNQFIFVKPAISTDYIDSHPATFESFYPNSQGIRHTMKRILRHFDWQVPFVKESWLVGRILRAAKKHFGTDWPLNELNLHIQVLNSAFYRNKTAYIFGQVFYGSVRNPFALAVVHDACTSGLSIDAALFDAQQIAVLFSFARAYFLVDMPVPSGYVHFLQAMLPMRSKGDLYTLLGLGKQGKNIFYREFSTHLCHSHDQFILAPGIKGLVMSVFTLPSFPYVFKVIKDTFGPNKDFDSAYVRQKYLLVKKHDRVGRMADTLEFTNVALPKTRCDEALLHELRTLAPSQIEETADLLIIRHVYIEYRLTPLNLFMQKASAKEKALAVIDYGYALKELAAANIFPGDMLYKNFGMTRFGRVIFYDYDEIEYMTDCNFRVIPPAPNPEYEMSGETWYPVNKGDVFPEEFGLFLLGEPDVRQVFLAHHKDLLTPEFWQRKKERLQQGILEDFYPYPQATRFKPSTLQQGLSDNTDA